MRRSKTALHLWLPRSLAALALFLLAVTAALGTSTREEIDGARRNLPSGAHPTAALDALLRGNEAYRAHDVQTALTEWSRAAELDPDYLPPRLHLARVFLLSQPSRAAGAIHEVLDIARRDFRAQRWLLGNACMATAVSFAFASLLVIAGLLLRHLRALHHGLAEGIAFLLRSKTPAGPLAWGVLAIPVLANLGALVTGCFWVFLASFRFGRGERILALGAGAVALLLAPYLLLTRPFWGQAVDGRDALGIYAMQQAPSLPPLRSEIEAWSQADPNSGAASFLEGLAHMGAGNPTRANEWYRRAALDPDVPPRVLENNFANALASAGHRSEALLRYQRAIELEPRAFEPYYNLALANAARGKYLEADRELDRASRVNLDRLRALGRDGSADGSLAPVEALWNTSELWAWSLSHPAGGEPPALLRWMFPLRSVFWTTPLVALAVGLGLFAGKALRQLIRVHVCYQCAKPVCRRCLVRLDRRAYCTTCAESLGGNSTEETTRLLLHRLLDERPAWSTRVLPWLSVLIPGIGPVRYGQPGWAAWTSLLTGLALGLLWYPAWGTGLVSFRFGDPAVDWLRGMGLLLLCLASLSSLLGYHLGRRREQSLRGFLSRDVDRLAA